MTAFADEFKRQRLLFSNSQSRVAEAAGLNHSYVSRMEAGTRIPSREVIDRLAFVMSSKPYDHDRLLTLAGYMPHDLDGLMKNQRECRDLLAYLTDDSIDLSQRNAVRVVVAHLLFLVKGESTNG